MHPICVIYNRCITEGYFPLEWKKANVIPILKKDRDYRPISILPFFGKGLERIIRDRLVLPSVKAYFNASQFGFIPNNFGGCGNAVTSLRLSILQHLLMNGGCCRLLAIDFKKAFDSVDHSVLMAAWWNSLIFLRKLCF